MVGSTAAAAWGVARMTRDVDIVVLLTPEDGEAMLEALKVDKVYFPADELGIAEDLAELLGE